MVRFIIATVAAFLCTAAVASPIVEMSASNSTLVNESECRWQNVTSADIRSARPDVDPWSPDFPPMYNPRGQDSGQKSWIVDIDDCDVVAGDRIFGMKLQQGTRFSASKTERGISLKIGGYPSVPKPSDPAGGGQLKDRNEFEVVTKEAQAADSLFGELREDELLKVNGGVRYVAFSMFLPLDYEPPETLIDDKPRWVLHFQAHQAGGGAPPLSMRVKATPNADDPVMLQFELLNDTIMKNRDESENGNGFPADELLGDPTPDGRKTGYLIERGIWHNFVVRLEPRTEKINNVPNRKGYMVIWHNGRKIFSEQKHWGYERRKRPHHSAISLKFGIYRGRQERTQIIVFNQIQYSFTKDTLDSALFRKPARR